MKHYHHHYHHYHHVNNFVYGILAKVALLNTIVVNNINQEDYSIIVGVDIIIAITLVLLFNIIFCVV